MLSGDNNCYYDDNKYSHNRRRVNFKRILSFPSEIRKLFHNTHFQTKLLYHFFFPSLTQILLIPILSNFSILSGNATVIFW